MEPSRARIPILDALLRAGPSSLTELAKEVRARPPTVLAHLDVLRSEGMVRRHPGPPVRYEAVPSASFVWSAPEHQRVLSWRVNGDIDWRFPLVSRIPDERARRTLTRFLQIAESRGLLAPRPKKSPGATWIVFGSCATGQAGATSDVDVVVVEEDEGGRSDRLRDALFAAEVEAVGWGDRREVDLHISRTEIIAPWMRDAIRVTGIPIYANRPTPTIPWSANPTPLPTSATALKSSSRSPRARPKNTSSTRPLAKRAPPPS